MAKFNRAGGRRGRAMSMTSKTMDSDAADDHQAKETKLILDRDSQQELHINPIRDAKGLPRILRPTDPPSGQESCAAPFAKELDLWPGEVIAALRAFSRFEAGETVGRLVSETDYVGIHRKIRKERSHYRDLDGSRVKPGKEVRAGAEPPNDNNGGKRNASGPLRTIMVRLMPHEAEIANSELDPEALNRAIDETAKAFEDAVGGEVVTAAVHRMRSGDLHIHLQFTMVLREEESPTMKGRRLGPWKRMAIRTTREHLAQLENLSPGPRIVSREQRALVESGVIAPPPPPEMIFRKVKGTRSLGEGAILGYSFRQKINLVRLAEEANLPDLANQVSEKRDVSGRFKFFRKQSDAALEANYLDVWLERVWRKSVLKVLPDAVLGDIKQMGVEAARDYATHGTVMVEKTHLRKWKNKLSEKEAAVEAREKDAECRGLNHALIKLGGGESESPAGQTAEGLIEQIDLLAERRVNLAELGGLRRLFRQLLPKEKIPHYDDTRECQRILSVRLDEELERLGGVEARAASDIRYAHQGLEKVWSELGGTHEPGTEDEVSESADKPVTIAGWLERIRNQVHHRIAGIKSDFLSTWLGMFTGLMHLDETVESKETKLGSAVLEIYEDARKESWISIFRHFNDKRDPEGETVAEIENQVETTLRQRIGDGIKQGLAGVFGIFGASPPASDDPKEIEVALNQSSISHKESSEKEVLCDFLRVLQGGEFREEAVAGLDKIALQKLIVDAAEMFKGGVESQQLIATGKTARSIFGYEEGDRVLETVANPASAIKREIKRLKDADELLEKVLPLVPVQPVGSPREKLIQAIRSVIGQRPVRVEVKEPQTGGTVPPIGESD